MIDLFSLMIIAICLISLIFGSITDLKTREVPDWLNFTLIAAGILIRSMYSIITWSYEPLLFGILGLILGVAIALLMFYTGQWGGGDSKMLMGLGALLGFDLTFSSLLISFIFAVIFIGAIYGFIWTFILALKNWKKFKKQFHAYMHTPLHFKIRITSFTISFALLIIMFLFIKSIKTRLLLLVLIITYYILMYLYIFIKTIEEICMIKFISTSKLTEGDWIVDEVKVGKKTVASSKDLGISHEQILKIKQSGIKKVKIKEGIPFLPSFLLSFIFVLVFGNIVELLVSLI